MRKEYGGMGFRLFFGFNLAMLGKQGWNLLNNQDTIVTRIYKAKYFPKFDFLGARLGHNPSYICRSIYDSQVLVRGGQRWLIGNGKSILVWSMPWLREEGNSYVSSAQVQGTGNMKVADLMDTNGSSWNWGLIEGIFNAQDKEAISKLSLLNCEREDKIIWKFNSKGSYTVKSTYRYAMETLVDNEEYRILGEWTSLSRMKIPQKIKVFLWRMLRGVLPTRMHLQDKDVSCNNSFPFFKQIMKMIGTSLLGVKRRNLFGKWLNCGN
jgi:hypothetical protein